LSNDSPLPSPLYPYSEAPRPTYRAPGGIPRQANRRWLHLALFGFTLLSTTYAGTDHYRAFIRDFDRPLDLALFLNGLWYSGTILAILTAHEMGHYLYCRRYHLDASLPYFLPAPVLLTGTLGAVIRIREPFHTRTQLFDVGIAGPIAGLLVLIPALFFGLGLSSIVPSPTEGVVLFLGEPLLFQWAAQLMLGPIADGQTINIHPIVFACWFGMLATALNLVPFGQFDGGHIVYAVFGDRIASRVSALAVVASAALVALSWTWVLPAVLMAVMWRLMGLRHPSPIYPYESLPAGRRVFAVLALIAFIVCFTPAPLRIAELVSTTAP
jgi:membrane-associated protease RseP (regulator of RpoE activity)